MQISQRKVNFPRESKTSEQLDSKKVMMMRSEWETRRLTRWKSHVTLLSLRASEWKEREEHKLPVRQVWQVEQWPQAFHERSHAIHSAKVDTTCIHFCNFSHYRLHSIASTFQILFIKLSRLRVPRLTLNAFARYYFTHFSTLIKPLIHTRVEGVSSFHLQERLVTCIPLTLRWRCSIFRPPWGHDYLSTVTVLVHYWRSIANHRNIH